ncbi:MAG: DUF1256 domain-containing protein [Bacillota bacterium]
MRTLEVRYDAPGAANAIAGLLREALASYQPAQPAVLCLGTDHYLGDCFGPLVGTILEEHGLAVPVVGTLKKPVTNKDLAEAAQALRASGACPIMVVDAMLGKEAGVIRVGGWPMRPGMGRAQPLGELRLGGSVAKEVGGDDDYIALATAGLGLVIGMARVAAGAILEAFGRREGGALCLKLGQGLLWPQVV